MIKRMAWMVLICLLVIAVALPSCKPPPEEEAEAPAEGKQTETGAVAETGAKDSGTPATSEQEPGEGATEPQYGGTITLSTTSVRASFDPPAAKPQGWQIELVYNTLMCPDWEKGPAGTGECLFNSQFYPDDCYRPLLAESWEVIDLETTRVKLKEGIHFHNKPPVNGREIVADDVVFSLYYHQDHPMSSLYRPEEKDKVRAVAVDKYTVEFSFSKPDPFEQMHNYGHWLRILPSEMADMDMENWRNSIGSGSYFLTDFVPDSSCTYDKNPYYWGKIRINGKQYDLPFADTVKVLLIPDRATMLSALRVGKIDQQVLNWEDAADITASAPAVLTRRVPANYAQSLEFKIDLEPFDDIKVRKALSMAIDRQKIIDSYYGGNAEILPWPVRRSGGDIYTPLEALPDECRELWEYHPERAKQLLADAGYATGLKLKLQIPNTTQYVDLATVVKQYWDAIGVETELDPTESGNFYQILFAHNQTGAVMCAWSNASPWAFAEWMYRTGGVWNYSCIKDAWFDAQYDEAREMVDFDQRNARLKELNLYAMKQCWNTALPLEQQIAVWWPWLKNYSGAVGISPNFIQAHYCWVDQDLKASLMK